jgi:hypothetical protein
MYVERVAKGKIETGICLFLSLGKCHLNLRKWDIPEQFAAAGNAIWQVNLWVNAIQTKNWIESPPLGASILTK